MSTSNDAVTIISAWWGWKKYSDVTDKVQKFFDDDKEFKVDITNLGDPAPGENKFLNISLECSNFSSPQSISFREGDFIYTNKVCKIKEAYWGWQTGMKVVTDVINTAFFCYKSFKVGVAMLGDPAVGSQKFLWICTTTGVIKQYVEDWEIKREES